MSDLEAQITAMAEQMETLRRRLVSSEAAAAELKTKQEKMEADAKEVDRSRSAGDGAGRAGRVRYQGLGAGLGSATTGLHLVNGVSRSPPPKFPSKATITQIVAWRQRTRFYIDRLRLGHTISAEAPPIPVVNCSDESDLIRSYGEALVMDHQRALEVLLEATSHAPFADRLYACSSIPEMWDKIDEWSLPSSPTERNHLTQQLENVAMRGDEDPRNFFARIDSLLATLRTVGVEYIEEDVVEIVLRQLPPQYDSDVTSISNQHEFSPTLAQLESLIRKSYLRRQTKQLGSPSTPASSGAPVNSHALVLGSGVPSGDARGRFGYRTGGGRPRTGHQRQPRHQQQPQQQRQQHHPQPQRPHRNQQLQSHPRPGHKAGEICPGVGGSFDCGRNAEYWQPDSPPPPGTPMGAVYHCARCGRLGHSAPFCTAPRRFEGTCGICKEHGHMARRCLLRHHQAPQPLPPPHANIVTPQGDVYYGTLGDGLSSPSTGGTVAGKAAPLQLEAATPPEPVGPGSAVVDDGDEYFGWTPSATPQPPALTSSMDVDLDFFTAPAGDADNDPGALAGPIGGTLPDDDINHIFTLQRLPPPHALATVFPDARPGSSLWVADNAATFHSTPSSDLVYDKRPPLPRERVLATGCGRRLEVESIGKLDLIVHCDQDIRITLVNVVVIPDLAFNLMSLHRISDVHDITLNATSVSLLGGRIQFKKLFTGSYLQATRVPPTSDPVAMAAAVMRPGKPRSMNINDLHHALGHAHEATIRETAKQMGIHVTGTQGYCDGCAEAKAIKSSVPKSVDPSRKSTRPLQRVFIDLAGPYPASTGGSRYCMMVVDDFSNFGWPVFLRDKSGPTVLTAFRAWHVAVKSLISAHGQVECVFSDNGNEFVNTSFRNLLVDLGIKAELTPVDGAKRNGRVERRIALVAEAAKAAFREFPKLFPDLEFPARALNWTAIWPEAFTWATDSINLQAQLTDKPDMRCPSVKLLGRRPTNLVLPFMMPGFRHRIRPNKMESKGERCFYLNTGNNHSSSTHKIILPSGQVSFSADVTFGYRRAPFVGEVPTWGSGAVAPAHVAPANRVSPVASVGGGGALTPAAASSAASTHTAVPDGRVSPVASVEGATASPSLAATNTVSPVVPIGGAAAAPPVAATSVAATAGAVPTVRTSPVASLAGASTSTTAAAARTGATAAGASSDRSFPNASAGGAIASTAAAPEGMGSPAPIPPAHASTSTHATAPATPARTMVPLRHNRIHEATPAVTRAQARLQRFASHPGPAPLGALAVLSPNNPAQGPSLAPVSGKPPAPPRGTSTLLVADENITRRLYDTPAMGEPPLPAGMACDLETPETFDQSQRGPHRQIWDAAMAKEVQGLDAVGTFEQASGI